MQANQLYFQNTSSIIVRVLPLHWLEQVQLHGVLDLSKVRTMDSICLSVLLAFHRELELHAGPRSFQLTRVQSRMMALFRMTRIDRLFTIHEDAPA